MSSMVLEMPVATQLVMPAASPQRAVVQERLSTTIYDGLFARLKEQYRIPDAERVFAFLRQHTPLIGVLLEGRQVVSLFFGEEAPILLRLRRDPDVGLEYLVAWIQTPLPSNEAVDRLFAMSDAWWIEQLAIVGDLLNFNLGGHP